MPKKYNATFWHNGHVIGNGYGSSLGIALQRGARDIASEVPSNCVVENVKIDVSQVGASQSNKARLPGMPQITQAELNRLAACVANDLGGSEEYAAEFETARYALEKIAIIFGLSKP